MGGFQGADTEQLREHADLMRERASSLDGLRTRLSMLVAHGATWDGADAEAFRNRWRSELLPRFDEQISALEDRGTSLEDHAEEQDEASEVEQSPSLLEDVLSLPKAAQDVFTGYKDLRKLVDDFPKHMDEWKQAFEDGPGKAWAKYKDDLAEGLRKGLKFDEEYSTIAKKLMGELGLPDSVGNWDPLKDTLDGQKFPSWLDNAAPNLAKAGKIGGKLIPGLDIGMGVEQMVNGETTFDKASGGLAAAGGTMVLAAPLFGPAAPVVAGIGAAAGIVSVGMDLGKMAWDHREAIGDFAGNVAEGIAGGVSDVAGGISDAASSASDAIGDGLESAGDALKDVGGSIGDALGFG